MKLSKEELLRAKEAIAIFENNKLKMATAKSFIKRASNDLDLLEQNSFNFAVVNRYTDRTLKNLHSAMNHLVAAKEVILNFTAANPIAYNQAKYIIDLTNEILYYTNKLKVLMQNRGLI